MYVERHGAGPRAFLALHGWGADRRAFAPLAARVPGGASLFCADLPGCGRSPAPRAWTLGAVTDEVVGAAERVLAETNGEALTFVGNCGGAVFALLAAQRLGGRAGRVVMIDPFAYLPRYLRLFVSEGFGRRAYRATFVSALGRRVTSRALKAGGLGDADLTETFASTDHEAARAYLRLFDEVGGVGRFRGLSLPAEIVYGERSFGAVRRSVGMWREVLPRARAWELRGAGHAPVAEATRELSRIVFAESKEGFKE